MKQTLTLDGKKMSTLLLWAVRSLEIFMWEEDYGLTPESPQPEFWPEDNWTDEDKDAEEISEKDICWQVQVEYTDRSAQRIVSCEYGLPDRPEELYFALLGYFAPEPV